MRRLLATIHCDVTLQLRQGFYYASAFVLVVCVAVVSRIPTLNLSWLLPAIIVGNLMMNTFYFIGGLVLLEKGEGTLEAQVVTPLRTWEYLASKISTLTLLALVENIVIVILLAGVGFEVLPMATSIVLTSIIYCLAGVVAVVRYDSINEYLMPSVLYSSLLLAPLLPYMIQWDGWLLYLHPLHATLLLAQAAFQPMAYWQMIYGVFYSMLWVGLMVYFGQYAFRRFIIGGAGAK
jgi:fluoroquinolone transport system permease protein